MSAAGPLKDRFKDKGGNKMNKEKSLIKFLLVLVMTVTAFGSVYAASYDIKEMTPQVKSALDARRARFETLTALKAEGKIGENNTGYVEVLVPGSGVEEVVKPENIDRETIYKAIVSQNGLPADQSSVVEKVFAQVQRDKAAAGDSIQDESGQWVKK